MIASFERQLRPARGRPAGALVLLHGRGTNEFDLLPLIAELDPERRLVGVTPRAPLELTPGGFHWYISRAVGYPDRDTFYETYGSLTRWLDALPEAIGVPWSRTLLGGFSMGAVMSYAAGLGAGRPAPAGILALSGFMPTVEGFELDLTGRDRFPVAIGHGTHDPIISVEFGRDARDRLEAAGAQVLYRESPMFHGIDPIFVHVLQKWLAEVIQGVPTDLVGRQGGRAIRIPYRDGQIRSCRRGPRAEHAGMSPLRVMLKPISGGWVIELTDSREIARFTGLAAGHRALRYLASHDIVNEAARAR